MLLDYFLLPHEFTPQEVRLLSTLADHAAVAMENPQLYRESVERVKALEEAAARVQQLQGLLPICAWCRKVRKEQNYWQSVESYVAQHSDVQGGVTGSVRIAGWRSRALVVDDEPEIRGVMVEYLEGKGYQAMGARGGRRRSGGFRSFGRT